MHDRRVMPAYIIGRIQVTDKARYSEYTKVTPDIIAEFGGHFIARGGESVTLEGPEETSRLVIIEFPTLDDAKAFFQSEEYAEAKKLREGAAVAQFVAIDGVVPS
jgi:uncharacterized protein (DUF1330 family)